jgi:hypothetical protein
VVGQSPSQAAHRLGVGLAAGEGAVVVGASSAAGHADLGQRDRVQSVVELAIALS